MNKTHRRRLVHVSAANRAAPIRSSTALRHFSPHSKAISPKASTSPHAHLPSPRPFRRHLRGLFSNSSSPFAPSSGDVPLSIRSLFLRYQSSPASPFPSPASAPSPPCTPSAYSLDNLSLMASPFPPDVVVDDAIVIVRKHFPLQTRRSQPPIRPR